MNTYFQCVCGCNAYVFSTHNWINISDELVLKICIHLWIVLLDRLITITFLLICKLIYRIRLPVLQYHLRRSNTIASGNNHCQQRKIVAKKKKSLLERYFLATIFIQRFCRRALSATILCFLVFFDDERGAEQNLCFTKSLCK